MRYAGFFDDLNYGRNGEGNIKDAVSSRPPPNHEEILGYLRDGNIVAQAPGLAVDVLDPEEPLGESIKLLSDGTWVWPNDLAYFFEKYNVRLPSDFVEHMRQHGWQCQQLPKEIVGYINGEPIYGVTGIAPFD